MEQDKRGSWARFIDVANTLIKSSAVIVAGAPTTLLIPLPLTMLVTRRFQREELLTRMHFMVPWARFSARTILGIDIDVQGTENLPRPSRGYLFVSNHQSYIDILVLIDALETVAFLSKGLVRFFPVLGRSAYAGGTVYLQRSSKEDRERALQETLRMCHESTAVVVFPEGTRSEDGELREKIHPRAMHEAWRHGLRVVPVGLDGTYEVMPKTNDRVRSGKRVAVRIGAALEPADFDSPESYAAACWDAVRRLFKQAQAARGR